MVSLLSCWNLLKFFFGRRQISFTGKLVIRSFLVKRVSIRPHFLHRYVFFSLTHFSSLHIKKCFLFALPHLIFVIWDRGDVEYEAFRITPDIKIYGGKVLTPRRSLMLMPVWECDCPGIPTCVVLPEIQILF